jgi:hypothetical protein
MLIGRKQELARLRKTILVRQSLLVHGRSGAGKTALLAEALCALSPRIRRLCLVCNACENPRALWRHLVLSLAEADDPQVMSRVQRECAGAISVDRWLRKQSSLRLRGILRRAMRAGTYWVFLDVTAPLPDGVCSLLQDWVWSKRTPVILFGRGPTEREVGKAGKLFWHSAMLLELLPLPAPDQQAVLEHSIARLNLSAVANDEFRGFILKRAAGFPGVIVRLCELASQSVYQSGGHIKLHTLAVDFLMQWADEPHSSRQDYPNA